MAPKLSKTQAKERAELGDPTVVRSYTGKIAKLTEKKNQESGRAQAFLRALNHYAAVLGITNQTDMFADQNATTPAEATEGEEANQIALSQGRKSGKDGGDLLANPYPDNDARRPYWASGWRQGQTDIATGLTPKDGPPITMPVEELAKSAEERRALEGDVAEEAPAPRRQPARRPAARKAADGAPTLQ